MTSMKVTRLSRHPVKSLTPEQVTQLHLTEDGRIQGDRVLAFRFRNAGDPGNWTWQTKQNFVGLINTPGLANLVASFDQASSVLRLQTDDLLIFEGDISDPSQRAAAEQSFTDYALTLFDNPLARYPERYPVALVGDGVQPLFHDTSAGLVTLYCEESLQALSESLGTDEIDGTRFRSNIVVSGLDEPMSEMSWIGREVKIGEIEFKVTKAVNRCLVTHVNPRTGVRDLDVMGELTREFTPEKPQFAVMLQARCPGGTISLQDEVELLS